VCSYTAGHKPTNKPYALELQQQSPQPQHQPQTRLWSLSVKLGEHAVEKRSTVSVGVRRVHLHLSAAPALPAGSEDRSIGTQPIHATTTEEDDDAEAGVAQLSAVTVQGESPPLMNLTTTLGRRARTTDNSNGAGASNGVSPAREHQQRYVLLQANSVYSLSLPPLDEDDHAGEEVHALHMRSWRNERTPLQLHSTAESAIAARLPVALTPLRPRGHRKGDMAASASPGAAAASAHTTAAAASVAAPAAASSKKHRSTAVVGSKRRRSSAYRAVTSSDDEAEDGNANWLQKSLHDPDDEEADDDDDPPFHLAGRPTHIAFSANGGDDGGDGSPSSEAVTAAAAASDASSASTASSSAEAAAARSSFSSASLASDDPSSPAAASACGRSSKRRRLPSMRAKEALESAKQLELLSPN
jgi:hypothetical protein